MELPGEDGLDVRPEVAAEALQAVDGHGPQQRLHGVREHQGLLVGLVQPAAELGQELVHRDAPAAREAELSRHLLPQLIRLKF